MFIRDSPLCLEMFCDPLGDYNVWGTLFPMVENITKDDVILATAHVRV